MRNIIAIDLDNVLVENTAFADSCRDLGLRDIISRTWGYNDIPVELKKRIYEKYNDPDYMCNLKPVKGAQEKVRELSKRYFVECLSSRSLSISTQTKIMVDKLFPEICITIINKSPKVLYCVENGIKYWIDDNPDGMIEAALNGINCILISNESTPYNHEFLASLSYQHFLRISSSSSISEINI
jgi:5'(3')-deoxyribonucleotidase